jgi:fatty acid desaturase
MVASTVTGEKDLVNVGVLGVESKSVLSLTEPLRKANYPWNVYYIGYAHALAYLSVFALSYAKAFNPENSLLWTIPLGWAIYCVWMVGHEGYHSTMAPSHMNRLNNWIGYLTMDCVINSKSTWIVKHHVIHHPHPLRITPPPEDRQRLFGPNVLVETLNIIYSVLQYWILDLQDLMEKVDIWKILALVIRFTYLFSLPLNALVATVFSLAVMANYNALLAHGIPCQLPTKDGIVRQCRTSLDIFPESKLCVFLTGALNCHCVHHLLPALPRALHPKIAMKLKKCMPSEYRCVDTWKELGALWILRHKNFSDVVLVSDLPELTRKSGTAFTQLLSDALSVVFLTAVCWYIPALRLMDLVMH